MLRSRIATTLALLTLAGGLTSALPAAASAAAGKAAAEPPVPVCAEAWNPGRAYTGGLTASHGGRNWQARWWTKNNTPGGSSGVWIDKGACEDRGFVVGEAEFERIFPNRNALYTYQGLITALSAYPAFTSTGGQTVARQEAAAFLAHVYHATGGLAFTHATDPAGYPQYCDEAQPYGCPAGRSAYYPRGALALSHNSAYKAAGDALGIDLLNNPGLVQREPSVAWATAVWAWTTQKGHGTMTPHEAMTGGHGFGETVRSLKGTPECTAGDPPRINRYVNFYHSISATLGVPLAEPVYC
ncbi:glycoside hydrolase family 19 protein [Sinosporangium siamense]|uniref:Chitinase n=1 Tax=Sinosporangium siamense TaxID=1367973 RepID=A0A919V9L3_9ACTN|nr:glycoside hydrolase family 19 protein [Sinosporangium siamense]GII94427.1 chitinase [Sinosporangium siamense]